MNLSYAKGNFIETFRRESLSDLKLIRVYIAAQRKAEADILEFDRRLREGVASGLGPEQKGDAKIREALKPMVYAVPLGSDIDIEDKEGSVLLDLTDLIDAMPSQGAGPFFQGNLNAIFSELSVQQVKLQSHIRDYAEQLQLKAASCPK